MRYFRALALAVLLLIGSAGPVSAAPRPPHEPINWLPCDAEGELIGIQTFRPDLHVVDYTIDLTACGSSADPFYYAMVAFGSGGWGIGRAIRAIGSGSFSTDLLLHAPVAICLMASSTIRIACREVVYTDGSAALGAAVPTGSALVFGPIDIAPPAVGPSCPSCW